MAVQSVTMCVPHAETFAAARGAATSIFGLLDRKPKIDSLCKEGIKPRRVIGEVKLEDVHFSYPARPDIKVSPRPNLFANQPQTLFNTYYFANLS